MRAPVHVFTSALVAVAPADPPARAGILHDNGDPSLGYGTAVLSELDTINQVGDELVLTGPATVSSVEWWGQGDGTDFTIRVFEVTGGVPASTPMTDQDVSVTGTPEDYFGQTYLRYLAEIPGLPLDAGTYVLSVVDRDAANWYWAASCEDGCEGQSWRRALDGEPWTAGNFAFAFRALGLPPLAAGGPDVCYASTGVVDGGRLLSIDLTTGAGTLLTDLTGVARMAALAIDSQGRLFGVRDGATTDSLSSVDPGTGATCSAPAGAYAALAFDAADVLYGIEGTELRTVDPVCGTSASLGTLAIAGPATGMAFDPTDGTLWACSSTEIFTVDVTTLAVTSVGVVTGAPLLTDLVFDAAGNLFASAGGGGLPDNVLLSIDRETTAGTTVGNIGFPAVSGLALRPTPSSTSAAVGPARTLSTRNVPNPFRPRTTIVFEVPRAGRTTVDIFDVGGRLVRRLLDAELPAGTHSCPWDGTGPDGRRVVSGHYVYRVRVGDTEGVVGRMVLLR